jgi:cytochrome c551
VRAPAGVALLAAGAVLCGCGGGDDGDDDDDAQRTSRRPVAAASSADPGLRVWAAQGCGSCHTLAAAGSSGTFGPDLGETLRGARARSSAGRSSIPPRRPPPATPPA